VYFLERTRAPAFAETGDPGFFESPGVALHIDFYTDFAYHSIMANGRVLVIDDEASIRELLCDFLSSEAIACSNVATLAQALELLKDNSFNLVLLDRNLDAIRGEQIIPRIRRIHPGIPVVIMTGDHQFNENSLKHVAADGILHKPFKFDEFMQLVGKFVESE